MEVCGRIPKGLSSAFSYPLLSKTGPYTGTLVYRQRNSTHNERLLCLRRRQAYNKRRSLYSADKHSSCLVKEIKTALFNTLWNAPRILLHDDVEAVLMRIWPYNHLQCPADEQFSLQPFPDKSVWFQFTDPEGMDGLVGIGGKSDPRTWYRMPAVAPVRMVNSIPHPYFFLDSNILISPESN